MTDTQLTTRQSNDSQAFTLRFNIYTFSLSGDASWSEQCIIYRPPVTSPRCPSIPIPVDDGPICEKGNYRGDLTLFVYLHDLAGGTLQVSFVDCWC